MSQIIWQSLTFPFLSWLLSYNLLLAAEAQKLWRIWPDPVGPSMSPTLSNVTVTPGTTATLPCQVANLGDKTVSWIREIDLTVLTVDRISYTGDSRFSIKHLENTDDWPLILADVTSTDEGFYDCQVNTHPKLSTKIYLQVVPRHLINEGESSQLDIAVSDTGRAGEIQARISNKNDHYNNRAPHSESLPGPQNDFAIAINDEGLINKNVGDVLKLACEASGKGVELYLAMKPPEESLLHWMLDGVPIKNLFAESKINIKEKATEGGKIKSILKIDALAAEDSGKISCFSPHSDSPTSSIILNVMEEKRTEQHYLGASVNKLNKETQTYLYQKTSAVSSMIKKDSDKTNSSNSLFPFCLLASISSLLLLLLNFICH